MPNHDFTWCVRKLRYCSDVIHSFDWKSAVEHLKCVILYIVKDIPTFIMYYVYEESRLFYL